MSAYSGIALALLAAGQSSRFGKRDKLSALLGNKMLGLHAAETAAAIPFSQKLVIGSAALASTEQWRALGYQLISNEDAALGQAHSVRLAAAQAIDTGASALCIMLADMPFVTREHIDRLVTAFGQSGRIVASARNGQAMPPAIFPFETFQSLTSLAGDSGARKLLANAALIAGDDPLLMDIDTQDDLAQANIISNQIK